MSAVHTQLLILVVSLLMCVCRTVREWTLDSVKMHGTNIKKCELICDLENVKRRYGLIQQYNMNSFHAASDLWKSVYHGIS